MASFIQNTENCLPAEIYRLYLRILAGLLLGNTDMYLKNFAMFHTKDGLLTPSYDQVASFIYNYKTLALAINGISNLQLGSLKPIHIIKLGEEFDLPKSSIQMAVDELEKNRDAALEAIIETKIGTSRFKNELINLIKKRWNGTFSLIGKNLSKKQ